MATAAACNRVSRFPAGPAVAWARAAGGTVCVAEDVDGACTYLDTPGPAVPSGVSLVRLQPVQLLAGAAAGADARWHYVVATDVQPGHQSELERWYDTERLPGLAAVPGVVRAAAYRVTEGAGPRSHTCYELAERAAFNSPRWLAVRGTDWSTRVRPAFFNTRRRMYCRLP